MSHIPTHGKQEILTLTNGEMLGDLFRERPDQYGLRGDTGLWTELETRLLDVPMPKTFAALWQQLEKAYLEKVGQSLRNPTPVYVARFDQGGMSTGFVHPPTWSTKLFPTINERFVDFWNARPIKTKRKGSPRK